MKFGGWIRAIVAIVALAMPAMMFAATQNAVLYGEVYDSAGNPAPNISVSLDNAAIGFARTTVTGADGSYNFPEVPPAENYTLSAARNGSKIDARAGIVVNVGDEKVVLPPLKEQSVAVAASATPNPEVTAKVITAPAVSNDVSTAISGVITGEQLRSLPVAVNRNFLNAGLIPPSTHDVQQGSQLAGASFSVSGNRPQTNNFLLDGADNVASSTNQAVPFQVNDSVQEFRVTSGTANAEYGRNMGGTVNIVTKRATNGFHGSTFGFFNNDALNANSPLSVYNGSTFEKAAVYSGPVNNPTVNCSTFSSGVPCFLPQTYNDYVSNAAALGFCTNSISTTAAAGLAPCPASAGLFGRNDFFDPASLLATHDNKNLPFDSKQFGGSAGGALIKDKLFAFGSYEGTLIDNPNPIFERVPSSFDRTFNPYGSGQEGFSNNLNDPICATNTVGCKSYALDQNILSLYPKSNVVGVPGVLEFFQGQAPNYTNVHNGLFRTDYVYSEKTDLSLRYVIQDLNQLHDDTLPEQSQYIGNGILRHALNQNLSATMSHTFNSSWVTDARVGFSRFGLTENPQDAGLDARTLGLPNSQLPAILLNGLDPQYGGASPGINGAFAGWSDVFVINQTVDLFPTLDGRFPLARLGAPLGAPFDRRDTTWFFADNTSWTYGKHGVKFGLEYRRLDNRAEDFSFSRGFMYSSDLGEFTNDSEACNFECAESFGPLGFNAFLRPSFDFFQQQSEPYKSDLNSFAAAGYIQDSWHIHPRVTVNYGLRYEYFSPPKDAHDRLFNYDPIANALVPENQVESPVNIVDPFGNSCSPTITGYQAVPGVTASSSIAPGNGSWRCGVSNDHFSQIVTSDTNNFAPRLGVAWDVFGTGKTVFRAAAGYFYDQLPASYVSQLMYNRPTTSPNAIYGTTALGFQSVCPVILVTCGNGSALVQPGLLNAASGVSNKSGSLANSFFASAEQPFAIYARDTAHSNTPYSRQLTATIQQQLGSKMTLEVGYLGDHGTNLPVLYNQNFANEGNVIRNGVAGNFSLFPIYTLTNQGSSDYNSLLVRVRAADWHGLRVNGSYIWSHSIDNASDGVFPPEPLTAPNLAIGYGIFGQLSPVGQCLFQSNKPGSYPCAITVNTPGGGKSTQAVPLTLPIINFNPGAVTTTGAGQIITSRYLIPQDPFNFLTNDRGNSDFDIRHRAVVDYTWDVPAFSKAWGWPTWMDHWQLSGVVTAQTGQPFSIFSGPIGGEITQRVNLTGPVDVTSNPAGAISVSGLQLASASASCIPVAAVAASPGGSGFFGNFLQPSPGTACTGDSGRNEFTGPGYVNTNVAIQKGFAVFGEGRMLTFRTEVYNVFNHSNFFNPISSYSLDGQTLNPEFGKILSSHEPRQIQFAVRFSW